eukprot:CAMPEP_0172597016 /NCGR_PEP_ID=MMETSP1068-20121228/16926_1 /TAXON_ID=35684 /ORGANISM="Pseudopedinella elastica, Strain CCMP716" /LENGTH=302 /DNA_ID=CAMNT_0013396313 /DNA_START=106 /DNA_END=1013 /DNA_ORIENTATION=+
MALGLRLGALDSGGSLGLTCGLRGGEPFPRGLSERFLSRGLSSRDREKRGARSDRGEDRKVDRGEAEGGGGGGGGAPGGLGLGAPGVRLGRKLASLAASPMSALTENPDENPDEKPEVAGRLLESASRRVALGGLVLKRPGRPPAAGFASDLRAASGSRASDASLLAPLLHNLLAPPRARRALRAWWVGWRFGCRLLKERGFSRGAGHERKALLFEREDFGPARGRLAPRLLLFQWRRPFPLKIGGGGGGGEGGGVEVHLVVAIPREHSPHQADAPRGHVLVRPLPGHEVAHPKPRGGPFGQ